MFLCFYSYSYALRRLENNHFQYLRQAVIHLEQKIAERAGQGQVPIHPVELDEATSRLNPLTLRRIVGLVIRGERLRSAPYTGDAAAVSGVATPQTLSPHKHCHRRGTGHLVSKVLVLAHGPVTLQKAFPYGDGYVTIFVLGPLDNVAVEMYGSIASNFGASVSYHSDSVDTGLRCTQDKVQVSIMDVPSFHNIKKPEN
jgi:hypothetical protein